MRELNWKLDAETMGLAVLSAGDAAAFLSGVNPSLFTIRTFNNNWGTCDDIRLGMLIGNAMALVVGLGSTFVSGSWWPFVITLGAAATLDIAYEWALRNPRNAAQ